MIVGDDMGKNTKKKKNAGSTAAYRKADMEARKWAGIINADRRKEFDRGLMTATVVVLWMMHREYGFGQTRLYRIIKQIVQYNTNYIAPAYDPKREEGTFEGLSLEEMCKALAEECSIYINVEKGRAYGSKEAMEVDV